MSAKAKKKARQHTVYRTKDGTRVPGTTTITGVMDKPALRHWANRIGLEGVKMSEYVNALADIGTLAHAIISEYIGGTPVDKDAYSPDQFDQAENAVLKFYAWEEQHKVEYLASELQLVSEEHKYGGTIDCYVNLDGKLTLIDFKTGKAVYDEAYTQVTAYAALLAEHGKQVDDVRVLRIGRDESEGFDDLTVPNLELHWKRFLACLELYEANKALRRAK